MHFCDLLKRCTVGLCTAFSAVALFITTAHAASEESFTVFESGQVRPLAMSDDGKTLFAVNTPDNALEIFNITDAGLDHKTTVAVGLEPVAVAVHNDSEVWVVNHLSDSISIVRVEKDSAHVVRTLLVGDEPRDIVFAGVNKERAFITTAHRGQNVPYDPQFTTPGIGRADVWVFDADDLGNTLAGEPINIIQLFSDTPRALAVSSDGKTVYAAGFKTGNKTATVWEGLVTANGGLPEPRIDSVGEEQPFSGLIVKHDGAKWTDELDRNWDNFVNFNLPDKDVFAIDAVANPPVQISGDNGFYSSVGTVLFNMIVNPKNGAVYVTNTEALNDKRFEGEGLTHSAGTVRGHFIENRISVIKDGNVAVRHLNKHIDFDNCCDAINNDVNARSLAQPTDMAITQDGSTLYVAAFGSGKVGIFDTKALEDDSFQPDAQKQVVLSAGGPSGVVLDENRKRLYVLTRFDNGISVVDTAQKAEIGHVNMYNPEPASVVAGRPFLYDASYTSSHGNSSCAGCHIYGDMDDLAWDLGDPDGTTFDVPGPWVNRPAKIGRPFVPETFRALKGPMTTQSLRGMANHGPMHWRGDRTGGIINGEIQESAQPDTGSFNEEIAFTQFNPAFVGLIGRDVELTEGEMQLFTDFALQIMYPPNPNRNLDNTLTEQQQRGHDFYFNRRVDTFFTCNGCHKIDANANAEFGVAKPGFFGTDGRYTAGGVLFQIVKVPHIRNAYQKVGMFGFPSIPQLVNSVIDGEINPHMGDQIRGFGFHHDGSQDTLFTFFKRKAFLVRDPGTNNPNDPGNDGFSRDLADGDAERRDMEAFVLAAPTNLAPVVGQQVTLTTQSVGDAHVRINLLIARAEAGECDLVAKKSNDRGYYYVGNRKFQSNIAATQVEDGVMRADAVSTKGEEVTYTCTPPGSGIRIGIDRDEDGVYDGDERILGSDPADENSKPATI